MIASYAPAIFGIVFSCPDAGYFGVGNGVSGPFDKRTTHRQPFQGIHHQVADDIFLIVSAILSQSAIWQG